MAASPAGGTAFAMVFVSGEVFWLMSRRCAVFQDPAGGAVFEDVPCGV